MSDIPAIVWCQYHVHIALLADRVARAVKGRVDVLSKA